MVPRVDRRFKSIQQHIPWQVHQAEMAAVQLYSHAHCLQSAGQMRHLLVAYSAGPYGAALADGSEYDGSYADRVTEEQLMDFHAKRLRVSIFPLHHS